MLKTAKTITNLIKMSNKKNHAIRVKKVKFVNSGIEKCPLAVVLGLTAAMIDRYGKSTLSGSEPQIANPVPHCRIDRGNDTGKILLILVDDTYRTFLFFKVEKVCTIKHKKRKFFLCELLL